MSLPAPVWILAAPFSGASWLASCLGRHPQLYVTPELNLLMADRVGELLDIFDIGQGAHAHGLLRTLAEIAFDGQTDAGVARARQWLEQRRDMSCEALGQWLATQLAPRCLVMPDSEAPLRPMHLRRLIAHWPGSRVIHHLRHPWEQGCLLAAWARERLFVPPDFKDHAFHPAQIEPQIPWLRANHNLVRMLAELPATRWRRTHSEQVEQTPHQALAAVCEWLQVSADRDALAAMDEPQAWTYAVQGPGSAPQGLEPELDEPFTEATLALAQRTSLIGPLPWRDDGAGFDPQVRALAAALGYPLDRVAERREAALP